MLALYKLLDITRTLLRYRELYSTQHRYDLWGNCNNLQLFTFSLWTITLCDFAVHLSKAPIYFSTSKKMKEEELRVPQWLIQHLPSRSDQADWNRFGWVEDRWAIEKVMSSILFSLVCLVFVIMCLFCCYFAGYR